MKFKAHPRAEIFDKATKRTVGFFDRNGIYETEDKRLQQIILECGYKEIENKPIEEDDMQMLSDQDMIEMKEYFSQFPKKELVEQAKEIGIVDVEKLSKQDLVNRIMGG